ncbi:hypothetical protein [Aquabacterium sp. J223]|uniref:hypothetical protein n=1 Tax=Aquabacterium sp. J223 TaxID=2898431 RepID=UPI0021ADA833|nr:hypothetical protein [Aquabacterium sp. J223]UUX97310.1 hypothetical protein LRS07_08745 [Aquabacterium sp. J223]
MKSSRNRAKFSEAEGPIVVRSDDGTVSYRLQPTRHGLCVERERKQVCGRARLVHTAIFRDSACFLRWCEADSVRFDYPIVFSDIRRKGGALLENHERTAHADRDHAGR